MFLKNSRYYGQTTIDSQDGSGRDVQAVKLRRLPDTPGEPYTTVQYSKLDAIGKTQYNDATRFWRIADANSELEANALVAETNRTISVPKT
jgi:hypothetical protein